MRTTISAAAALKIIAPAKTNPTKGMFPSRRLPQDLVPADGVFLYLLWRPACNLREVNIPSPTKRLYTMTRSFSKAKLRRGTLRALEGKCGAEGQGGAAA
jgi:hypothetical protein